AATGAGVDLKTNRNEFVKNRFSPRLTIKKMTTSVQTNQSSYSLPEDFLSRPGPEKAVQKIDFTRTSLPEYDGHYAVVVDNALTEEECECLVRAAEAKNGGEWEQAMVNVGGGRQKLMPDVRDCGRIIWDDSDIVAKIWSRVKDSVPEIEFLKDRPGVTGNGPMKRKETLKVSRLNERMRFLRYESSQYFCQAHVDGTFATPDNQEKSFFTLHLYLNESDPNASENPLEGGATTFHSQNMERSYDVSPKVGRVLIFQHRNLLHSGADVLKGIKMTLRTDIMYKVVDPGS
ncbi:hypothetical protein MMC29_008246, partial [Sticta canariensis]|nr:hypothetical protein [Sticta canariensis]